MGERESAVTITGREGGGRERENVCVCVCVSGVCFTCVLRLVCSCTGVCMVRQIEEGVSAQRVSRQCLHTARDTVSAVSVSTPSASCVLYLCVFNMINTLYMTDICYCCRKATAGAAYSSRPHQTLRFHLIHIYMYIHVRMGAAVLNEYGGD